MVEGHVDVQSRSRDVLDDHVVRARDEDLAAPVPAHRVDDSGREVHRAAVVA